MHFYEDKIVCIHLKCREERSQKRGPVNVCLTFMYSDTLRYSVGRWDRDITEKTDSEDQGGLVPEGERKLHSF